MSKNLVSDRLFINPNKNLLSKLDSRITTLESFQKISEDLNILNKQEKSLKSSRAELKITDLEARAGHLEEKDLQSMVNISHQCELHTIHLQQTEEIDVIKADFEEISFNIENDDKISTMVEEWNEKLLAMQRSLDTLNKRIEKLESLPLNQEIQYLHRNITEEKIRKEQEDVKLELIQEQVDQITARLQGFFSDSHEIENEQEVFLQGLNSFKWH